MRFELPCVAVDWGTTHMRAMLCDSEMSSPVDKIEGNGISNLRNSPADELLRAIKPWTSKYGKVDLLLGGMVGADLGWRSTPYLECPLELRDLASELVTFRENGHRVAIVPGVGCTNLLGQPDFMRGEEIQVLGWIKRSERAANAILCLPGTHTKWARLRDGRLDGFTTSLTGELYALLKDYSVLVQPNVRKSSTCDVAEFMKGVDVAAKHGSQLLHTLFSARSRVLSGLGATDGASSYLSGLLIGSDVKSAMSHSDETVGAIELIGTPDLCKRFALALERMGYESNISDGDEMVLEGFLDIVEASQ